MTKRHLLVLPLALVCLFLFGAEGCSSDASIGAYGNGSNNGSDSICLLNNCDTDTDCTSCTEQRTSCSADKRCIACGPNANNKTCKAGTTCTKYGYCATNGLSCAEDGNGVPTITCRNNADCGACGPNFRVCDTTAGKCVGCSKDNTTNCQSTDFCNGGVCAAKCPAQCSQDSDCGVCNLGTSHEATACNKHVCAQCSPTKQCPNGGICDLDHGVCKAPCGITNGKTDCTSDANCAGCKGTTICKLPVNGGTGVCAAPANGCSDIGKGILVLPDPFSRVTQLCSNDNDCANTSVDFNVGEVLRDVTGLSAIKDGNISYAMHACAAVEVRDKACGLCVPCKVDSDCSDIDITKLAGDMFGKLGSVASKILLDKAFGPSDHKVHMFCEHVAGDYGACLPCPNLLSRCGQTTDAVPTTGACDHDLCTTGGPLGQQCDACVASVCAKDPWCCTTQWDAQCKTDVDLYCEKKTCEPDKCIYRQPNGWYCHSDKKSAYHCAANDQNELQIDDGVDCPTNFECQPTGDGQKDPASLCTDADVNVNGSQCTTDTVKAGKARCVQQN